MYSDEYYLNQLSYFLVFIPIFARKYTIMITEELQKLYLAYTGVPAENITELPSSGSNRRYFRLAGVQTLIGVYGTCIDENEAFLYMAAHFRRCGLPIPEIHIVSEDKTYYLQEDLGDTLLFHAIEKGRATSVFSEDEKEQISESLEIILKNPFQKIIITYFEKDKKKQGGCYKTLIGIIKGIDNYNGILKMKSGEIIKIEDLKKIQLV